MKRLAFYAAIIAATLALLILLWQFRSIVILLIFSLVMTAALRPSVRFLEERGMRAGLARALVYLLLFGLVGLALFLISGPLLEELRTLTNYLVVLYDNTYRMWAEGTALQQSIAARLPAPDELDETMIGPAGAAALQVVFGVTQNALTIVAAIIVVTALSLYWSADHNHFERLWLSLLPAGRRIQARRIWQKTEGTMGAYMRSEVIQSFLAVVLLVLGYTFIRNDYPILTGLLAGVAWLIPMVGFIFAALISFLFGLASNGGLTAAVGALVVTTAVLAFLEFVVEPRLFRRSQFSGVLIVVVILMMVDAYGLIGFLIAPPLAVALQVLTNQVIQAIRRPATAALEFSTIEERLAALSAHYPAVDSAAGGENTMPPEIASLYVRLKALVDGSRGLAWDEGILNQQNVAVLPTER